MKYLNQNQFQSTHLYKVRLDKRKKGNQWWYFNPRTYTRCDLQVFLFCLLNAISIHAPIQGAIKTLDVETETVIFQSTHLYKVRSSRNTQASAKKDFNPRTYTRCDQLFYQIYYLNYLFQFNPRTYTRCDRYVIS